MRCVQLICAMVLALTAACSSPDQRKAGEPVRVFMWMFGGVEEQDKWLRGAVDNFNAVQSGIRVEYETRDWATQRESLITSTIAGEGPDIIRVHHKYSVEFGELGGLYPLDRFADYPQIREQILDNLWEHVSYKKTPFGLPIQILPFVMAVNKGMLAQYDLDVPKTWEEMVAMGPVLKKNGIHLFTMPAGLNQDTAYRFLPLLYKAGGRVFNDDWSKAAFNGPAGVKALEFLVGMKEKGFMPEACGAYAFDENAAALVYGEGDDFAGGAVVSVYHAQQLRFPDGQTAVVSDSGAGEAAGAASVAVVDGSGDGVDHRIYEGARGGVDGDEGAVV